MFIEYVQYIHRTYSLSGLMNAGRLEWLGLALLTLSIKAAVCEIPHFKCEKWRRPNLQVAHVSDSLGALMSKCLDSVEYIRYSLFSNRFADTMHKQRLSVRAFLFVYIFFCLAFRLALCIFGSIYPNRTRHLHRSVAHFQQNSHRQAPNVLYEHARPHIRHNHTKPIER